MIQNGQEIRQKWLDKNLLTKINKHLNKHLFYSA